MEINDRFPGKLNIIIKKQTKLKYIVRKGINLKNVVYYFFGPRAKTFRCIEPSKSKLTVDLITFEASVNLLWCWIWPTIVRLCKEN